MTRGLVATLLATVLVLGACGQKSDQTEMPGEDRAAAVSNSSEESLTPVTEADAVDVRIARAMSAAPVMISGEATILDMDGSILREGGNGWTCYPGVPLMPGSEDPMCNDSVWEAWIEAAKVGESFETEVLGFSYMLAGDGLVNNDNPASTDHSSGTWVQEGPHLMVLLPRSAIGDLPTSPAGKGAYVMWNDTPLFHVMVPVAGRPDGALMVDGEPVAVTGVATSDDEKIARAMTAAHADISAAAKIVDMDGSVLREGSNGWTCYPGVPLMAGSVDPMCNDAVWEAWIAAVKAGESFETETLGFSYMLAGDGLVNNDNPMATDKSAGTWIQEGPHLMVLLPRSAVGDIPTTPVLPGPYVMWNETPMFHLMVPVADRPEESLIVNEASESR